MNFYDELSAINEEIRFLEIARRDCESQLLALDDGRTYVNSLSKDDVLKYDKREVVELYNRQLKTELGPEFVTKNDPSEAETKLRRELAELMMKLTRTKTMRDEYIIAIQKASSITLADSISLLREIGIYYKIENIRGRIFLVPQDFKLNSFGSQSVATEEELARTIADYEYPIDNRARSSATVAPLFKRITKKTMIVVGKDDFRTFEFNGVEYPWVPNNRITKKEEIEPNDKLLIPVAGIEVVNNFGIPTYVRSGDDIALNDKILNIFPYDVLSFLEYYTMRRMDDIHLSMRELLKEYAPTVDEFLRNSKDDVAFINLPKKTEHK